MANKFFGPTTQKTQKNSGVGNSQTTPSDPVENDFKARNYAFTLYDETEDKLNNLIDYFNSISGLKYVLGREICPATKRPHIQGYFETTNNTMVSASKLNSIWPARWTKARKGAWNNVKYCSKDGNLIHSDWEFHKAYIVETIGGPDKPLYEWQKEIEKKIFEKPDGRTINWIWSKEGKMGKSDFVTYLCVKYPNKCTFATTAKSNDIVMLLSRSYDTYLLDFARATNRYELPYEGLENLINGRVGEAKLKKEVKRTIINKPHVYVFANLPPDKSMMSEDRWNIIQLDKEKAE